MKCTRFSFPDLDSLSRAAAEYIIQAAGEEVRTQGRFTLALSGGETPKPLYRLLAAPPWRARMPWARTYVFWGDERCVPPDSTESNFHNARELLLSRAPIPDGNIHRISAERGGEKAAADYQRELGDFFLSSGLQSGYFPVFDCLLLGVGGDGHIASLFPGARSLEEDTRWVVPVTAPRGVSPRERVTLTLPVINRAKRVLFLVSGIGKRDLFRGISDSAQADDTLPVSRVKPRGECVFYMDFAV